MSAKDVSPTFQRLQEIRKDAGMSEAMLAARAEVGPRTIQDANAGTSIGIKAVERMAQVLGYRLELVSMGTNSIR